MIDLAQLAATALAPKAARINPFARDNAGGVPDSEELNRVLSLVSRAPAVPSPATCHEFTRLFRAPGGTWDLWPIQVQALIEMAECRGLFAPIPVGGGKTAITFMAPVMLSARRPMLLIPAHLREKTRRDFEELWHHFLGFDPKSYRIESYQRLASVAQAEMLSRYLPDLIVCDEAHALKSTRTACARRIRRYLDANPDARFVALSGSITKRSLMDYVHLLKWALRLGSPAPRNAVDALPWANALDEKLAVGKRVLPGALGKLARSPEEAKRMALLATPEERLHTVREVFRRRLTETRGVVASNDAHLDCELTVREWSPGPDGMNMHWDNLRQAWRLPDGQDIVDAMELRRHARELALGFYYRWVEPGPRAWMDARREWGRYVRQILRHSDRFDTEFQVVRAVDKREAPRWQEGQTILGAWREIKPQFTPVTTPCWISTAVLRMVAAWARQTPGIVWVEHTAFGEALAQTSGFPYYAEEGIDARTGRFIGDADPARSFIASVKANGTGRNLQAWSRNFLTACPPTGAQTEQLLGRTHRPFQRAPEVVFDVLCNCWEHGYDVERVCADARYIQATTGVAQKLCSAAVQFPDLDELESRRGARWDAHNLRGKGVDSGDATR